ncbi:TetR/AcrR family transcriptional regulator [Oceanobacillus sp. CF4.6]|uniref:TetR/AcrR family transcriptional regulator n=1 Tax=Oceanobacillus sp. CF4.6 TaxID=3373080 RepID=UPI003EE6F00A
MKKKTIKTRAFKAQETKTSLYNSAIRLFKEKGFENVHIEEITEMAGTSKGSFYTYFKSKDDVIIEHYNQIDDVYEEVSNHLSNVALKEQIYKVLHAGFQFCDDIGYEFLSIVLSSQLSKNEKESLVINKDRRLYKIMINIFQQAEQSGQFSPKKPIGYYVQSILTYYRGLYLDFCLLKDPELKLSNYGRESMKLFIEQLTAYTNKTS